MLAQERCEKKLSNIEGAKVTTEIGKYASVVGNKALPVDFYLSSYTTCTLEQLLTLY